MSDDLTTISEATENSEKLLPREKVSDCRENKLLVRFRAAYFAFAGYRQHSRHCRKGINVQLGAVMINRWVARVFAMVLTCIHILVMIALMILVIAYVMHQQGLTASVGRPELVFDPANMVLVTKLTELFSKHIVLAYLLGAFIAYVIIVGCLATLIAINQNLERLNRLMTASDAGVGSWQNSEPPRR